MIKLDRYLKREFRKIRRRKKECAKLYPDWNDDEYNMLECKFVWGAPEYEKERHTSFNTDNLITVYYNRANERYYISLADSFFDLTSKESKDEYIKYILNIKEQFANFIFSLDEDGKIPFEPIHLSDIANYGLEGETLTQLYCRFCAIVKGIVDYYG